MAVFDRGNSFQAQKKFFYKLLYTSLLSVTMPHTVKLADGQPLTCHHWRQEASIFASLPFITVFVHAENDMAQGLWGALAVANRDGLPNEMLMVY